MADCCGLQKETDCYATPLDQDVASPVCRACGQKAKIVQRMTLEHLLRPDAAERLQKTVYRFCATPTCDVVYFSNAAAQYFHKPDLRVRVGLKETEHPVPICYCFDYTARDVEEDIATTGTTTIPDRIRAEVNAGNCRCETENPQGSCCLGNVGQVVKNVMAGAQTPVAK